jgi:hypothetical protein
MTRNLLKDEIVENWSGNDVLLVSGATRSMEEMVLLGDVMSIKRGSGYSDKTRFLQFLNGGIICSENLALALPIKSCMGELLRKSLDLVKYANLLK